MTREDAGWRPSKEEVEAAENRTVGDVLGPGLRVLFCGFNPGLYSGAVGHHFARPGNRFWTTLHGAGFTPRLLSPHEEGDLLGYGLGITNLVERATRGAQDLSDEELVAGGERLRAKVERYRPAWLAVVGIGGYRTAFGRRDASVGPQEETIGDTGIWVLPNPSGLNAHYRPPDLVEAFAALRRAAG